MKSLKKKTAFFALLLMASPVCAGPAEDESLKQTLEEAFRTSNEIHARFDTRYFWDDSSSVKVLVKDGVVTLRGIVQTFEARRGFIRIARETAGVSEVIEKIRVIPSARKVD